MNKKYVSFIVIAALLAVNAAVGLRGMTLNAQAGGSSDPLTSKGYVDKAVSDLRNEFAAMITGLSASGGDAGGGVSVSVAPSVYVPVSAPAGTLILGGEGCEIVLRSGSAAAFVPGENGLSDLTDGKDVAHGSPLTANHLLVIPRNDGRGVLAMTDCWFLIKGNYSISK